MPKGLESQQSALRQMLYISLLLLELVTYPSRELQIYSTRSVNITN